MAFGSVFWGWTGICVSEVCLRGLSAGFVGRVVGVTASATLPAMPAAGGFGTDPAWAERAGD
jgi:hypothetical protein